MSKLLKKRIIFPIICGVALLLSLVMALVFTPNAYAAEAYKLWVGGVQVTSDNLTGDGWEYTPGSEESTLTLNGFNYSGTGYNGTDTTNSSGASGLYSSIFYNENKKLNIELEGDNSINAQAVNNATYTCGICIHSTSDVEIKGEGRLIITLPNNNSSNSIGIFEAFMGNIIMSGGDLDISSSNNNSYGIRTNFGSFTMSSGNLNVNVGGSGSYSTSGLYISSSATFTGGTISLVASSNNDGSYGFYSNSNNGSLTIGSNVTSFLARGGSFAISGNSSFLVKNSLPGESYSDHSGTQGYAVIEINPTGESVGSNTYTGERYVCFAPYSDIDATISGYNGAYDGNDHTISIDVEDPTNATIKYGTTEGTYDLLTAPTYKNAGTYTIYYEISAYKYNTLTGSETVEITKLTPTYTNPTEKEDLEYTGTAQELVNQGSVTGGTYYYKIGEDGQWSSTIPTATNAGTYTVYYKIVGADNYTDIDNGSYFSINIETVEMDIVEPTAKSNLKYTGEVQTLINAGSVTGGEMLYSLDGINYSPELPEATNVGTYNVFYKIVEDANHFGGYEEYFNVEIKNGDVTINKTPTALTNLVYKAEEINLISAGEVTHGTIYYKLGADGIYSTSIPKATAAGNYTVYYKVVADDNYNDIAEVAIGVKINKKDSTIETEPTAKELSYTGEAQELINEGVAVGGKIKYSLDGINYSTELPTALKSGKYTVYYKVFADDNYNDTEVKTIDVEVSKTYSFDSFIWSDDCKEASAKYISMEDNNDYYLKDATVTSIVKEDATCLNKGTHTYTAEYETYNESKDVVDIDIIAHDLTHYDKVKPTTAAEGNIEYWKCESCGKYFKDNKGLEEISHDDTIIPKLETKINDENSLVKIEVVGNDSVAGFGAQVNLKVEVKSTIKAKEGTADYNAIKAHLKKNEVIAGVYDVKLILTVNGVETEIQPSDIKEGMIIKVRMTIPSDVNTKNLKLMHIHSANDIELINEYEQIDNEIIFNIDRLSEFAFINKVNTGLPVWLIVLIVISSIVLFVLLVYLLLFFVFNKWIVENDKAIRVIKIGKKDNQIKLLNMKFKAYLREDTNVYKTKKEALENK